MTALVGDEVLPAASCLGFRSASHHTDGGCGRDAG